MESFLNPKEDKFIRAIISGMAGGLLKDIPAVILEHFVKHPDPTFWDYMSLLALGRIARTWPEYLMAVTVQVLWCIGLANVFVYLRPKLKSKHYLMQGAAFGILIWITIRAAVYLFKAPELIHSHPLTAFINMAISMFYGIIVAIVDHKLQNLKK